MSILDDNIEWWVAGDSTVSGTHRGKAEVLEMFGKLAEKSMTTTPDRFIADGDDVVILTQVTAGGESWREADVFTYSGGKAVEGESFGDTALPERVFGRK